MSSSIQPDELQKYANSIRQLEYEIKNTEDKIKDLTYNISCPNSLEVSAFFQKMDRYIRETHDICNIMDEFADELERISAIYRCAAPPFLTLLAALILVLGGNKHVLSLNKLLQ